MKYLIPSADTEHRTLVNVEPDTPEWEAERLNSIGASEVAAVLGESSFQDSTPLRAWMRKRGLATSEFDPVHSYVSHAAEPLIAGWFERFHADKGRVLPGFMARSKKYPWLHATFDRIVELPDGTLVPLQLKTSSPFNKHKWYDGAIPADYVAQEDTECLILDDAPFAYLAVWHYGPTDFQLIKHRPDPARQLSMIARTNRFWYDYVLPGVPPPPVLGDNMRSLYPGRWGESKVASEDALDALARRVIARSDRAALLEPIDREVAETTFELEQYLGDATELVHPVTGDTVHHWRPRKDGVRVHFTPKPKEAVA